MLDELERLRRRLLPPGEILRIARHLENCCICVALARRKANAEDVAQTFALDREHPDTKTTLTDYVDEKLPLVERDHVDEHLESCAQCRQDIDDLMEERARIARRGRRLLYAIVSAAAAVAAMIFFLAIPGEPRRFDEVRPQTYERPDWDRAVRLAVESRNIARPEILNTLRPPLDAVRGAKAAPNALRPAGEVVDETRPALRWPAQRHARYVATIFDGERVVASSGEIRDASWIPPAPLARGVVYTWEVHISRGDKIIPAPPQPPAMFVIAGEQTARDLDEARRRYPNDHLLLGILYARAGMQSRAMQELSASPSDAAAQIGARIREW